MEWNMFIFHGVVRKENNKSGKMDGPYKLYYDKVLVKTEGVYLNGQLEGRMVLLS